MRGPVSTLVTSALAAALLACASPQSDDGALLVFAAASLAEALSEIEREYESATDAQVDVSFGASQMLAQQIASGAPADLFISAGALPVEFLRDQDALDDGVTDLLTNRLVVATRPGLAVEILSLSQLVTSDIERIALADPDLAPAGSYAREALRALGLWQDVEKKLVLGADVRTTLAYVETGNVDAALVYSTDALAAPNVRIADIVPADSYRPIVYPVALVGEGRNRKKAAEFAAFLSGERASRIFRAHGFQPMD